jgi:hypothetical protein
VASFGRAAARTEDGESGLNLGGHT